MSEGNRLTTIELFKEDMKFAAGHYTIFSKTEREALHGHNFSVYVSLTAEVDNNGMTFDYGIYKDKVRDLCKQLHEIFLIAGDSPHQTIEQDDTYYYINFNNEKIPFLKKDILILPLKNITVEELASWFLKKLSVQTDNTIHAMTVKIFSGPGQCGSAHFSSHQK